MAMLSAPKALGSIRRRSCKRNRVSGRILFCFPLNPLSYLIIRALMADLQARVILQQCMHAKLQVKPAEPDSEARWVEIQHGLIIYVCFFKGASEEIIPKMVNTLMNVRLSETEGGKYVSVLDLPGSILVIPQATLGGKLKGRNMQYHANIEKEIGLQLYSQFVNQCEKQLATNVKSVEAGVVLKHGTYGNRQVLKVDTNGPFTHMIEF